MEKVTHEIPPVFDRDSKILILGSIPSPLSRKTGFYYGHPQNRFWKVLSGVFEEETPQTIDEKKEFLCRHHIALWDVLASCEIKGASDSSIQNAVCNDFDVITKTADIKQVFTTGKTAYSYYKKFTGKDCVCLPSPSPANCAKSLNELIKEYERIKEYL